MTTEKQPEATGPRFPLRDADWLVDEMLEERNQQRFDWLKSELIRRAEPANPKGIAWETEFTLAVPTFDAQLAADQIRMDEALAKKDARIAELEAEIGNLEYQCTDHYASVDDKLQQTQEQLGQLRKALGAVRKNLAPQMQRVVDGALAATDNGEGNDGES